MDNYSKEQLIRVPIIVRFLNWLRRERGKPQEERAFGFRKWVKEHGGLDDEGNIKTDWAKKMWVYYRDKEDITADEGLIRDQLEKYLMGENPELMFE